MGDHAVNRFVEEVTVEPDAIARAREAALELGAEPISAAVGVQCATIAAVGSIWISSGGADVICTVLSTPRGVSGGALRLRAKANIGTSASAGASPIASPWSPTCP